MKMSSYRLKKYQIDFLKEKSGSSTLQYILMRYRRGDFEGVTQNDYENKNPQNVLQVYSIRKRFEGIGDSFMRNLIDLHLNIPDFHMNMELERAKKEEEALFITYTNQPYIIDEDSKK